MESGQKGNSRFTQSTLASVSPEEQGKGVRKTREVEECSRRKTVLPYTSLSWRKKQNEKQWEGEEGRD